MQRASVGMDVLQSSSQKAYMYKAFKAGIKRSTTDKTAMASADPLAVTTHAERTSRNANQVYKADH